MSHSDLVQTLPSLSRLIMEKRKRRGWSGRVLTLCPRNTALDPGTIARQRPCRLLRLALGSAAAVFFVLSLPHPAAAFERESVWLGFTGCEGKRTYFTLYLSAAEGNVSGELTGDLPAQTVSGTFRDGDLSLEPGEWMVRRPPRKAELQGLQGAYNRDLDVIYGTMSGGEQCQSFVARQLEVPRVGSNRDGLLSKLPANVKPQRVLSEADCKSYAQMLVGGTLGPSPRGGRFNSALGDHATMRQVLGRDIHDWSDEDGKRLRRLGQACRNILRKGSDPESAALAGEIRQKGGWIPAPLKQPRIGSGARAWQSLLLYLQPDTITDLERIDRLLMEGLVKIPGGSAETTDGDQTTVAEWVGLLTCSKGDRYLRLLLQEEGPPASVVLELGPGLETLHPRGAARLTGTFDDHQLRLEHLDWLHKPGHTARDAVPIGLSGEILEGGERVSGVVDGDPSCSSFRGYRTPKPREDKNANGLLYKVTGLRESTLTPPDCRRFAEWLARGRDLSLGGFRYNSLSLDDAAAWEVLGKDRRQWQGDDHLRFRTISGTCRKMLRGSSAPEDKARFEEVTTWVPAPFGSPKDDWKTFDWVRLSLLPIVNQEALARASANLDAARSLSPSLDHLDLIGASVNAGRDQKGDLRYLTTSQRDDYLMALERLRGALAEAIVQEAIVQFNEQPKSLQGLFSLEEETQDLQAELLKRGADNAAVGLKRAFGVEARSRATPLWQDLLARGEKEHAALSGAGYQRFSEIKELRDEARTLSHFFDPRSEEALAESYAAFRRSDQNVTLAMVERSLPGILAWIDAMEPSATANAALGNFVQETFQDQAIPESLPQLLEAAKRKRDAYNPKGFQRPDIALALIRAHWGEVSYKGFENLAYLVTSLRRLNEACPTLIETRGQPELTDLSAFVMAALENSIERLVRGEATSQGEAQRGVLLFVNVIFNQPGCQLDYFGYPTTNCTTQAEHDAAFEAIMTSSEAAYDMALLLRRGCEDPAALRYIEGYTDFVRQRPFTRSLPPVPLPDLVTMLKAQ